MAWVILKSAGDDFSFTSYKIDGRVGHPYQVAVNYAHQITEAMQGGWHTLKERKPEEEQYCLLTVKTKLGPFVPEEVFTYAAEVEEFYPVNEFDSEYRDGLTPKQVIAWMPLPQPYHGKES